MYVCRFETGPNDSTVAAAAAATAIAPIVNISLHDETPPHVCMHANEHEFEDQTAYATLQRIQLLLVFSFGDASNHFILCEIHSQYYVVW